MKLVPIAKTVAASCRYGDEACDVFVDALIIFEKSEADYQGFANIFGLLPNGKYFHYEWSYGSCSGCDEWEARNLSYEEIKQEMRNGANFFDSIDDVKKYLRLDKEFCAEMKYPCINSSTNGSVPGMLRVLTGAYSDDFINMALAFDEYLKDLKRMH